MLKDLALESAHAFAKRIKDQIAASLALFCWFYGHSLDLYVRLEPGGYTGKFECLFFEKVPNYTPLTQLPTEPHWMDLAVRMSNIRIGYTPSKMWLFS